MLKSEDFGFKYNIEIQSMYKFQLIQGAIICSTLMLLSPLILNSANCGFSLFCDHSSIPSKADEIQGDVIHNNKAVHTALRYRKVDLALYLHELQSIETGDHLYMPLFHDAVFIGKVDSITHSTNIHYSMRGRLKDSDTGFFFLSFTAGKALASIEIPAHNQEFSVVYVPAFESHIVFEVDMDRKDVLPEGPVLTPFGEY